MILDLKASVPWLRSDSVGRSCWLGTINLLSFGRCDLLGTSAGFAWFDAANHCRETQTAFGRPFYGVLLLQVLQCPMFTMKIPSPLCLILDMLCSVPSIRMRSASPSLTLLTRETSARGANPVPSQHTLLGSMCVLFVCQCAWDIPSIVHGEGPYASGVAGTVSIHKNWLFSGSKALLGTIGPVSRARVCELINFDADRPLSPPQRVP